ncbi:MAG: hypothetical protein AAGE01_15430 [Pseudomonadota bacterium]
MISDKSLAWQMIVDKNALVGDSPQRTISRVLAVLSLGARVLRSDGGAREIDLDEYTSFGVMLLLDNIVEALMDAEDKLSGREGHR